MQPRLTRLALAATAGYLIGTAPSAAVAARLAGAGDIRALGTGNPGAANAMTELGKKWGAAVLVADIAKGAIACGVGGRLAGDAGAHVAGPAAVAGHCYPVWTGFDGGKGLAASAGQTLATLPVYFVPELAVVGLTGALPWWKQRAHSAAVVGAVVRVVVAVTAWRRSWRGPWGPAPSVLLPIASTASVAMVLERFQSGRDRVEAHHERTRVAADG